MTPYRPLPMKRMGQATAALPALPPPELDPLYAGYIGIPGVIETLAVLGITGVAAYVGITTGLDKSESKTRKTLGWVGGIGSALLGALYLGGRTGVNQLVSLPAVRVTPV